METQIKQIKSLDELDSLTPGEDKVTVLDHPSFGSIRRVMTFGGKNKKGYSFLRFTFPDSNEITELVVDGKDITFADGGLQTKSKISYGLYEVSVGYQEKLNLIQMGK
jgi:hypothetical protein